MQIIKVVGLGGLGKTSRGQIVRIDEREGMALVISIMQQIMNRDPNTHRAEFIANDDGLNGRPSYFTISVHSSGVEEAYKKRVHELEILLRERALMGQDFPPKKRKLIKMESRKKKK
jgi:hypothetical protein